MAGMETKNKMRAQGLSDLLQVAALNAASLTILLPEWVGAVGEFVSAADIFLKIILTVTLIALNALKLRDYLKKKE